MSQATVMAQNDVLVSARSVLVTRIVSGVVALIGAPGTAIEPEEVSVAVDGKPPQGALITFYLRRSERQPIIVTVWSGNVGYGDYIRWSIGDTLLVEGSVGERIVESFSDPGEITALAAAGKERLDFVCRLIEAICVHSGQRRNPAASDVCNALVASLSPSPVDVPIALIGVGERQTLAVIQDGDTGAAPAIVQHFGKYGFSRPVGPSISDGCGMRLFRFEVPVDDLRSGSFALWVGNSVKVAGAKEIRACGPERLGLLLGSNTPITMPLVRWLSHSIKSEGATVLETEAVLRHVDIASRLPSKTEFWVGEHARVGLNAIFRAPDAGIAVFGWVVDSHDLLSEMAWIGPNGIKTRFDDKVLSIDHLGRPSEAENALEPGRRLRPFLASIKTPRPLLSLATEAFRVTFASGDSQEAFIAPPTHDPKTARDLILSMFDRTTHLDSAFDSGLGEIIGSFHRMALAAKSIESKVNIGSTPDDPRASIIIPIYGNTAYLSGQYAALALDPDVRRHDQVIYVVDDPSVAARVEAQLTGLYGIYRLAVTVLCHDNNYGYAPAINTGAQEATGDHLLLLNSDVIPAEKGFVRKLVRRLSVNPRVGAVGPKLLFSDGSIQHAGLSFARSVDDRVFNRTLFKGYPRDHRKANRRCEQEALTGACLLIRRDAWEAVGGLSEDYVVGDFEDTDLCLRLREIGFKLEYEPRVELFHFERQSIEQHEIHRTTRAEDYNRWLHMRRWFPNDVANLPLLGVPGAT